MKDHQIKNVTSDFLFIIWARGGFGSHQESRGQVNVTRILPAAWFSAETKLATIMSHRV